MATNDGHAPISVGLTTAETLNSILKSHNLEPSTTAQVSDGADGDNYVSPSTLKIYMNPILVNNDKTLARGSYICSTEGVTLGPGIVAYTMTLPTASGYTEIQLIDAHGNAQNRPMKIDGTVNGDVGGLILDVNHFNIKLVWNGTDWSLGGK